MRMLWISLFLLWPITSMAQQWAYIPLATEESQVSVVDTRGDGAADLVVLEGHSLLLYPRFDQRQVRRIELPPDVSAVDVADLDGDGIKSIVTIAHQRVLEIPLYGQQQTPRELFKHSLSLMQRDGHPYFYVFVLFRDTLPHILLPGDAELSVHSLAGQVLERIPVDEGGRHHSWFSQPFRSYAAKRARMVQENGLQFSVHYNHAVTPMLPSPWQVEKPLLLSEDERDMLFQQQQRSRSGDSPTQWPWAALEADEPRHRVYYTQTQDGNLHTLVHVQRNVGADAEKPRFKLGPKRRYAGNLVMVDGSLRDFTGDGYHDLMLWKAPPPPITVNGLSKALARGEWKYEVVIHPYGPESGRFAAEPWQRYTLTAPIVWFMGGRPPMQHFFAEDLNGDGMADFGFSPDKQVFKCFFSAEGNEESRQVVSLELDEPLEEIAFIQPYDASGRKVLALRSEQALHILLPERSSGTSSSVNEPGAMDLMVEYIRGLVVESD